MLARAIAPYQIDIMVAESHDSHTDFQVTRSLNLTRCIKLGYPLG